MKRVLSLVLVLVLALGSVPFAFAEDAAVMTAGETLKGYGLAKGVDAEGNLNEEGMLTRAEMMVMISRLLGVEEEAMNYAIPSTSKDVEGHWAAKYIAYAEQVGKWTSGVGENMFGSDDKVTTQMVAKFMMTALGYDVVWETATADATALGLLEGVTAEGNITRGEVFTAALNTIETPKKDSEVKLGVALGVMTEEVAPVAALEGAVIDAATGTGNAEVMIEFEEAVDMDAAAAATYVVTMKNDASKTIEVNMVNVESATLVTLQTEAMVKGTAYKVSVADTSAFFTGVEKDTDAPKISSVKGTDTDRVEVKFDMNVDAATAEDISNYSINTIGTVTAAKVSDDRTVVELTVEGFEKVSSHKLTIENVMSVDGKVMTKVVRTFYPSFDNSPVSIDEIKNVTRSNNEAIFVFFKDAHGVDKASAEDISNYSIDGLEILSAKATEDKYLASAQEAGEYSEDSDFYQRVELVTSTQKSNTKYTLKINNIVDGSTSMNVPTKELSETFYGASIDKTKPAMSSSISVLSSTLIRISFANEINKLDPTTVLDLSNYSIDEDELSIVDVQFRDEDEDLKEIDITLSEMEDGEAYKLEVNNIADEFGNSMDKARTAYFTGDVTKNAPQIKSIVSTDTETVKVTFVKIVTEVSAEEFTNYSLDGNIGSPTKAVAVDANDETTVTLTFPELTRNKTYKMTINGVENYSGYATDDATKSFIATAVDADEKKPTVENVSFEAKGMLKIEFSEEMTYTSGAKIAVSASTGVVYALATDLAGDNDEIVVFDATAINDHVDTQNKVLDIISFSTTVTDIAGNEVSYTTNDEEFSTASVDYTNAADSVEIVGWAQETVKEIRVFFDGEIAVEPTDEESNNITVNNVSALFELSVDSDDATVLIAKLKSGVLADGDKVFMNVSADVNDLAARDSFLYGSTSEIAKVTYEMFMDDETDPQIVEVVAIDAQTVEVTYDEDLSTAGTYKIKKSDDTYITNTTSLDDNVVTLTLSSDLDSDEYYTLTQSSLARDLSNRSAVKETSGFEFVGSDVLVEKNTIAGVSVLNGFTVRISDTDDFVDGTYELVGTVGSAVTVGSVFATTTPSSVNPGTDEVTFVVSSSTPFIKDVTYRINLPGEYQNNVDANTSDYITFEGIVEQGTLAQAAAMTRVSVATATTTAATATLTLSGLSALADYTVVITELGEATPGAIGAELTTVNAAATALDNVITLTMDGTKAQLDAAAGKVIMVTILDESDNPVMTSKSMAIQ